MRRRRAFTLIELLIVIAMLSILSGAFGTVVLFTTRAEVEERIRATLRQEGLSVVRAIVRDAHLARTFGESTLARDAGKMPALRDDEMLVLEMSSAGERAGRRIAYRRVGPRLERLVWDDATATSTVQALASHVRFWRIERSGDLVRLQIELAISRYTKEFTETYAVTTGVGGVFRFGGRRDTPVPPGRAEPEVGHAGTLPDWAVGRADTSPDRRVGLLHMQAGCLRYQR